MMLRVSQERSGAVSAFEDALDQISHQGFHHPAHLLIVINDRDVHLVATLCIRKRSPDHYAFQLRGVA